nr:hypothetical protein DGKKSRWO_DGKKSRWO_CDS_0109 [uncultured phage]CAI9752286.1 hypothetical protein CVNMHQAP_CVNMHQAP_CDS_0109 [uncultured phage]
MSEQNKIYYIENTPWKDKLDSDSIKRFSQLFYSDKIIFHFDFAYSYFKVLTKQKSNSVLFIAAINCCLRFYETIKRIYPYNEVYIIIYVEDKIAKTLKINSDTFQKVIDIIPDFAVVNSTKDLDYFNTANYKHIFYGKCSNAKAIFTNCETQSWSLFKGKIVVQ